MKSPEAEKVLKALEERYLAWSRREDPGYEPGTPAMELITLIRATQLDARMIERAVSELEAAGLAKHVGTAFQIGLTEKGIAGVRGREADEGR